MSFRLALAKRAVGVAAWLTGKKPMSYLPGRERIAMAFGMTPARLGSTMRAALSRGVSAWDAYHELVAAAEHLYLTDGGLRPIFDNIRVEICQSPYAVVPSPLDPRGKEIAEWLAGVIGNIPRWKRRMLWELSDGIYTGIGIVEQFGGPAANGDFIVDRVAGVEQWLVRPVEGLPGELDYRGELALPAANQPGRWEYRTAYDWQPVPDGKLLTWELDNKGSYITGGLMWPCLWYGMFKNFNFKDWVAFLETYGQPLRVGYYDAAATEDEREILARAVIDLATDAGVTIPKGMEIEFKAALGGDTQAFERMINVIDRYYSLIFSGGELTNLAGEKGARNLGVVHERRANYRVDFWGADMAEAISEGFCKPLVKWNFGERPGYPKYIFEASRIDELCTRWGIDKEAIDRNIPIPSTYFYRTYGWPVPEPGEGVIVPPAGKRPDSPTSPVTALSRGGFDGPVDPDFAMIDAYAERGAAEVVGQYTDLITRLTTAAEQIDTNGDDAELAARLQTTVGAKPQQAFRETLAAHLRDYLVAGLAAGVAATAADAQREGVGKKVDRGAMVDETFAALQAAAGVTTLSRGALLTNAAYAAHIAEFGRRPKLTLLQHVAIGDQGGGSEEDWHAVAPQRAIEFWAKRAGVTASRFAQMDSAARAYALHVAGIEDQAVIDAVVTGIRRSLETGATARDFARSIREACAAAGVDPLDPHRIQFIYHQNMMTAYGAARAASQHSAAVTKYLKYIELVTMGDSRVRPEHQRLNHLTLPADDPRWSELTPPLDYGCRCRTVSRLEPRAGAPTEAPMMPSRSAGFGGDGPVNTWRQFVAGGGR